MVYVIQKEFVTVNGFLDNINIVFCFINLKKEKREGKRIIVILYPRPVLLKIHNILNKTIHN